MAKIHLTKIGRVTACGKTLDKDFRTNRIENVTCKACLRVAEDGMTRVEIPIDNPQLVKLVHFCSTGQVIQPLCKAENVKLLSPDKSFVTCPECQRLFELRRV